MQQPPKWPKGKRVDQDSWELGNFAFSDQVQLTLTVLIAEARITNEAPAVIRKLCMVKKLLKNM